MRSHTANGSGPRSGWSVAAQTGAALAGAMGVGRFVFTPVLPLMESQAHLTILTELTSAQPHMTGWAYGGVGVGIATSGALVAVIKSVSDWQAAWWSSAGVTALLLAVAWRVGLAGRAGRRAPPPADPDSAPPRHRWFAILAVSYFLEGAGYIVAGTFLVAAISATGPSWLSSSVWIIVGAAAVPSCAAWTWLSRHVSRPTLITGALLLQAAGIALPALTAAVPAALAAAVLFGATFIGITTLSLATGRHLRVPRAVAILTAGYAIGQVLGPLVVEPTLHGSYRPALLVGASLVLAAAVCSALLRIQFPHLGEAHHRNRDTRRAAAPEPTTVP